MLGGLLLSTPAAIWAMSDREESSEDDSEDGNYYFEKRRKFRAARPYRIRFVSIKFGKKKEYFVPLGDNDFRLIEDEDKSARGKEEIWFDDANMDKLFAKLERAGWLIAKSQEEFAEKVNTAVNERLELEETVRRLTKLSEEGRDRNTAAKDRNRRTVFERSIWEKHSKKLIAGGVAFGFLTGVGAMYYFSNRH